MNVGKRINQVRKDKHLTAEQVAEQCSIAPIYLRQIEGGKRTPSMNLFIDLCNVLRISPNYLLQDDLEMNEVSEIQVLNELWEKAPPSSQRIATAMLKAMLEQDEMK